MSQPGGRLLQYHSLASIVGWDEKRLSVSRWLQLTCCLSCDEILWPKSISLSLTNCGPNGIRWPGGKSWCCHLQPVGHGMRWDEVRLPGSKSLHCHSHPVGHGMRWDGSVCLADNGSVTCLLLVMGWDLMRLPGRNHGTVTYTLLVMGCDMMRHPGRKSLQCATHIL